MNERTLSRLRWMAVASLCVVMAGCSGRVAPTTRPIVTTGAGPETASAGDGETASGHRGDGYQPGFYPLRVGNRWDYLVTVIHRITPFEGDPRPAEGYQLLASRRQVATQPYDGRDYVLEDVIWGETDASPTMSVWYRQDATGLYELDFARHTRADVAVAPAATGATTGPWSLPALERSLAGMPATEQAAYRLAAQRLGERIARLGVALCRTPGSPMAGTAGLRFPSTAAPYELTRLRYPLEAKSRWVVRADFGITVVSEFVAVETLELRPGDLVGYRIRVRSSWMGPNDSYNVWFGPSGFLQSAIHAEVDAVDNAGNIIGTVTVDQREELQSLHLADPSLPARPPWLVPRRK